jgi:protein-S-isoprenylcysteine O-methyltransferase Ste14
MLVAKGLARVVAQVALFAALLLIPAGTWAWPRAIQFLVGFAVVHTIATLALAWLAPESLEARLPTASEEKPPKADRIVALFLGLMLLGWFIFIPIDVFRLQLLRPPSLELSTFGGLLWLAGYVVMVASLVQNEFAQPVVKDQADRGQVLIDTGLYAHVRHPMYLGALLFFAGIALWLESTASFLAVPLAFAPLIARIFVEEKALRETLDGYPDYMERVRFRIIPFVW